MQASWKVVTSCYFSFPCYLFGMRSSHSVSPNFSLPSFSPNVFFCSLLCATPCHVTYTSVIQCQPCRQGCERFFFNPFASWNHSSLHLSHGCFTTLGITWNSLPAVVDQWDKEETATVNFCHTHTVYKY